jgi:hypothetical protein
MWECGAGRLHQKSVSHGCVTFYIGSSQKYHQPDRHHHERTKQTHTYTITSHTTALLLYYALYYVWCVSDDDDDDVVNHCIFLSGVKGIVPFLSDRFNFMSFRDPSSNCTVNRAGKRAENEAGKRR